MQQRYGGTAFFTLVIAVAIGLITDLHDTGMGDVLDSGSRETRKTWEWE